MTPTYRLASSKDIPAIRQLDRDSFGALFTELTGRPDTLSLREPEYFAHWLQTDPEGAWVATVDQEVIAFNFNHARGSRSWFGPLAVKPGIQLRGIGRALCERGIEYLERQGCESIGLDTYANNPVSVSLYLKLGFEIVGGTVLLTRPTETPVAAQAADLTAVTAGSADLHELAALDESQSGFQRVPDYRFALDWDKAQVLALRDADGAARGGAICLLKRGDGFLGAVFVDEAAFGRGGLATMLEAARRFYRAQGATAMQVVAEASDLRLTDALFDLGFKTHLTLVRMVREPRTDAGPVRGPLSLEKG